MHDRISCTHLVRISSVALGALLGTVLMDASVCRLGYLAVQLVWVWLRAWYGQLILCAFSVDTLLYRKANAVSAGLQHAGGVPRLAGPERPRTAQYALLSAACGACDAWSLLLGPASGDAHVLSLAVFVLGGRWPGSALMVYTCYTQPVPSVHGRLRIGAAAASRSQ